LRMRIYKGEKKTPPDGGGGAADAARGLRFKADFFCGCRF